MQTDGLRDAQSIALGFVFLDESDRTSMVRDARASLHHHQAVVEPPPRQQQQRQQPYQQPYQQQYQQPSTTTTTRFSSSSNYNNNDYDNDNAVAAFHRSNSTIQREEDEELRSGRDFAVQMAMGSSRDNDNNNNNDNNGDYQIYTTMQDERLRQKLAIQDGNQQLRPQTQEERQRQRRESQQQQLKHQERNSNSAASYAKQVAAAPGPVGRAATAPVNSSRRSSAGLAKNAPVLGKGVTVGAVWVDGINSGSPPPAQETARPQPDYDDHDDDVENDNGNDRPNRNRNRKRSSTTNVTPDIPLGFPQHDDDRGRQQQQQQHPQQSSRHPRDAADNQKGTKSNGGFLSSKNIAIGTCLILVIVAIAVTIPLFILDKNGGGAELADSQSSSNNNNNNDKDSMDDSSSPYSITDLYPIDAVHAQVSSTICRESIPGQGRSELCRAGALMNVFGGGACNVVARAFLEMSNDDDNNNNDMVDIAFVPAGACASDIVKGDFTTEDAIELLPDFDEPLYTVKCSGTQIILFLRQILQDVFENWSHVVPEDLPPPQPPSNSGLPPPPTDAGGANPTYYPYAAGLRYDVHASADFLDRVTNLEMFNTTTRQYEPFNMDATYIVLIPEDMAKEFRMMPWDEQYYKDTGMRTTATFIEYAIARSVLIDLPREDSSTQTFVP